ncbi:MAG: peptide chain release factor N(5)-glutamine methyltransferase [Polyangiaceae bacterium]
MSSVGTQPLVWTIDAVLRWAADDFRSRAIETPRLDAEILLARVLSTTRVQLIVDSTRALAADELARFREVVKRRRAREPVAYIVGEREFYGRTFRVDRRVLVPRPDTEALVDAALERTRHASMSMRALDLCTGSGCVAITLARERPTSRVFASDLSTDALAVARENAQRLGAHTVAFRQGDLFEAIPSGCRFDVITANAPYIETAEIAGLEPEVREYEPRLALDGGVDGMDIVRRIVDGAAGHLTQAGVLALEVGSGEARLAAELLLHSGFSEIETRRDYGRIERVVSGVLNPR